MHSQALAAGIRVPIHHFNRTVHCVFRQTCHVRLKSHALLPLLPSEQNNVPYDIRLNILSQPASLDFIPVDQSAAFRGGILRICGSDFPSICDLHCPGTSISTGCAWIFADPPESKDASGGETMSLPGSDSAHDLNLGFMLALVYNVVYKLMVGISDIKPAVFSGGSFPNS